MTPIETMLYFVHERESIRLKREHGQPAPWTEDPILQTYRFCNVRRRDDRVSRWLREHVLLQKHIDYDLRSFLMFSAWCRWINWPPTIAAAMAEGFYPKKRIDWKRLGQFVDRLNKTQKVWTGAYMIRAPKKKGGKKGRFVAEHVINKSFASVVPKLVTAFRADEPSPSCCETWKVLCTADSWGSFMSGQVVADWSYTGLLSGAFDLRTWAPMGPGSVRGYNRLVGVTPITKRPKEEAWLMLLQHCRSTIIAGLGQQYVDLDLMSVQNVMCELDKFMRVRNGEGRPRAKYQPHTY
jgi:hypothetical protein